MLSFRTPPRVHHHTQALLPSNSCCFLTPGTPPVAVDELFHCSTLSGHSQRLPKMVYDYCASGAEDQWTLKENRHAFERIRFRPRIPIDVSNVDASTAVLGHKISMRIMVAPTTMQRVAHPEGKLATARAVASHNTIVMKWNPASGNNTIKETKRGSLLPCFAAEESTQQPDSASDKSMWPFLLPRPLIYSSSFSDVDPVQLSDLWATTLKVRRDPKKVLKALRHSFAFIVVLAEVDEVSSSGVVRRLKTVGVGRAISDGTFIASICDVAVDPAYQRRGIGRRLVKRLVQNMKKTGGPSGYAVFPPPIARRFFWMIGFRSEKKYRLMAYRGQADERDVNLLDKEKSVYMELSVRRAE